MVGLIIYLTGLIPAYVMYKKMHIVSMEEGWKQVDRFAGLLYATLSWFGFIAYTIVWVCCNDKFDKPAKW